MNTTSESSTPSGPFNSSNVVDRNLRALIEHAAQQEHAKSAADRVASAISGFVGSMTFVCFHAVGYGLWAAVDMGWIPGIRNFDPSFTKLGTFAAVEAIFIATFVLIAQNRLAAQEEIRNQLDVQVSLLNERETTHILRLVAAMSGKMGLGEARDPEIEDLVRHVEPQEMIDRIAVHVDAVDEKIRKEKS